jgi:hypothetical protein
MGSTLVLYWVEIRFIVIKLEKVILYTMEVSIRSYPPLHRQYNIRKLNFRVDVGPRN